MKTRKLFFVASVALSATLLLGSCGPGKYTPKPNEEISGTWINEKMDMQKHVYSAGGLKDYLHASDAAPFYEITEQIVAKWTDSEGSIWYKTFDTVTKGGTIGGQKFTTLVKLSKSATVLEDTWLFPSSDQELQHPKFPMKIDPNSGYYAIYYRAKE